MLHSKKLIVAVLSGIATFFSMSADASQLIGDSMIAEKDMKLGPNTLLLTEEVIDSPFVYHDGKEAFEAVNRASEKGEAVTLYVAPGVYWLDDPDDPEVRVNPRRNGEVPYAVEIKCDSLSIVGLADDPSDIVFAVNRGQTQGALGNYTMIHFQGSALNVENLTFGNYCNVDLEYPRDPSRNRPKRRDAIVQAQIGWLDGTDKLFARNCRFISRLNLCPLMGARRSLYKDCYFECTDDALTGTAVYLGCDFTFHSGKPLYSAPETGVVFLDCDIHTLTQGTQYFTKVPGMVTAIDTRFTSPGDVVLRWTRDSSPVRCYQSGITLNGKPVVVDSTRPELGVILDGKPLMEAYKITDPDGGIIYNIPNLVGGEDGWDPLGYMPKIREAEKRFGRRLTGIPVALLVRSSKKESEAQGDTIAFDARQYLWGEKQSLPVEESVISSPCRWNTTEGIRISGDGMKVEGISCNDVPEARNVLVSVADDSGLSGACEVLVQSYLKEAPYFKKKPKLKPSKGGETLTLDYKLTGIGEDLSEIVWYRATLPDFSDTIAVRKGFGKDAGSYMLTPADNGKRIAVRVTPRYADSMRGERSPLAALKKVIDRGGEETELSTSFAEIPIRGKGDGLNHVLPGYWIFDSYKPEDTSGHTWEADGKPGWYYGKGVDAATGTGLVQSVRGARLSYTPVREKTETMKVSLVAEPAKGPGQGFGSATGQYMDICLMFDPVSLSGYALRIERTPDYDKAVVFSIVKYEDGLTTPVTEAMPTSCFRTPCNIDVEYLGKTIKAIASTEAPDVVSKDPRIRKDVFLRYTIPDKEKSAGSSLMIQHTGTTGAGATLLRDLNISWQ